MALSESDKRILWIVVSICLVFAFGVTVGMGIAK